MDFEAKNFPYTIAGQELVERARTDFGPIYQQWVAASKTLAHHRNDPRGHANEHLDANLDLILRGIEQEQALCMTLKGEKFGGGVFFFQIALSKAWLFSVYEIIRQSCETRCRSREKPNEYCREDGCIRCQAIRPLRDMLNTHRIPLAKMQPESLPRTAPSITNYLSELEIQNENGSIGWRSHSDRTGKTITTSRLEISDEILKVLGDWKAA